MSEPAARLRHRWLLWAGMALTVLAAGLGWGYATGDLEARADDAGVPLTLVETDVRAGAILLACVAGLVVFAVTLLAFVLLNPAPTGGRRIVQLVAGGLFLSIVVGLVAFAAVLYPDLQGNVTQR